MQNMSFGVGSYHELAPFNSTGECAGVEGNMRHRIARAQVAGFEAILAEHAAVAATWRENHQCPKCHRWFGDTVEYEPPLPPQQPFSPSKQPLVVPRAPHSYALCCSCSDAPVFCFACMRELHVDDVVVAGSLEAAALALMEPDDEREGQHVVARLTTLDPSVAASLRATALVAIESGDPFALLPREDDFEVLAPPAATRGGFGLSSVMPTTWWDGEALGAHLLLRAEAARRAEIEMLFARELPARAVVFAMIADAAFVAVPSQLQRECECELLALKAEFDAVLASLAARHAAAIVVEHDVLGRCFSAIDERALAAQRAAEAQRAADLARQRATADPLQLIELDEAAGRAALQQDAEPAAWAALAAAMTDEAHWRQRAELAGELIYQHERLGHQLLQSVFFSSFAGIVSAKYVERLALMGAKAEQRAQQLMLQQDHATSRLADVAQIERDARNALRCLAQQSRLCAREAQHRRALASEAWTLLLGEVHNAQKLARFAIERAYVLERRAMLGTFWAHTRIDEKTLSAALAPNYARMLDALRRRLADWTVQFLVCGDGQRFGLPLVDVFVWPDDARRRMSLTWPVRFALQPHHFGPTALGGGGNVGGLLVRSGSFSNSARGMPSGRRRSSSNASATWGAAQGVVSRLRGVEGLSASGSAGGGASGGASGSVTPSQAALQALQQQQPMPVHSGRARSSTLRPNQYGGLDSARSVAGGGAAGGGITPWITPRSQAHTVSETVLNGALAAEVAACPPRSALSVIAALLDVPTFTGAVVFTATALVEDAAVWHRACAAGQATLVARYSQRGVFRATFDTYDEFVHEAAQAKWDVLVLGWERERLANLEARAHRRAARAAMRVKAPLQRSTATAVAALETSGTRQMSPQASLQAPSGEDPFGRSGGGRRRSSHAAGVFGSGDEAEAADGQEPETPRGEALAAHIAAAALSAPPSLLDLRESFFGAKFLFGPSIRVFTRSLADDDGAVSRTPQPRRTAASSFDAAGAASAAATPPPLFVSQRPERPPGAFAALTESAAHRKKTVAAAATAFKAGQQAAVDALVTSVNVERPVAAASAAALQPLLPPAPASLLLTPRKTGLSPRQQRSRAHFLATPRAGSAMNDTSGSVMVTSPSGALGGGAAAAAAANATTPPAGSASSAVRRRRSSISFDAFFDD